MNFDLIKLAHAEENQENAAVVGHEPAASSGGIALNASDVGLHALNFLILLAILKFILYKPLVKLLQDRETRIREGVENAEKSDLLLKESTLSREKMLKEARAESQSMVEEARQSGEQIRTDIIGKAQAESQHIIVTGKNLLDTEKAKALKELRGQAVEMVIKTAEKLLREKVDSAKDAQLIEESLELYTN